MAEESEFELVGPLYCGKALLDIPWRIIPQFTLLLRLKPIVSMIALATFAHYGPQIRVFGQNEPETEKKHDCVAEESEFELVGPL